jgi:hypothetical protein
MAKMGKPGCGARDAWDHHDGLRRHLPTFFTGHPYEETVWTLGPAELLPRLKIAVMSPDPRTGLWVYATVGASAARSDPTSLLEFVLTAPAEDLRHAELMTMTAYDHHTEGFGLGHTFPIGEPWLSGSACDHMLISLPYPFGPELEVCCLGERELSFYWVLLITRAERDFKAEHGQEALEQRFNAQAIEFWDPRRPSAA